MVLSSGDKVRTRKSPGDGGWKRPLDANLLFPLPVPEAYGRVKSQVCNEKNPQSNRKCLEA